MPSIYSKFIAESDANTNILNSRSANYPFMFYEIVIIKWGEGV